MNAFSEIKIVNVLPLWSHFDCWGSHHDGLSSISAPALDLDQVLWNRVINEAGQIAEPRRAGYGVNL